MHSGSLARCKKRKYNDAERSNAEFMKKKWWWGVVATKSTVAKLKQDAVFPRSFEVVQPIWEHDVSDSSAVSLGAH